MRIADFGLRSGARLPAAHAPYQRLATPQSTLTVALPSALTVSWIGIVLLLVTAAVGLYLVQMSLVATAGYDLQRLEVERDGWRARNEQLDLELAKRRSLPWVESQAVQRLGMVRAGKPEYLVVGQTGQAPTGQLAARQAPGPSR